MHDIGVDQSVEKFMAAAEKCKPNIIGMSALLTTTMTYMKTVIDGFEKAGQQPHQDGRRRRADQPDVRRRNRRRRLRRRRLERRRSVSATGGKGVTAMATYRDSLLAGDSLADRGRGRRRTRSSCRCRRTFHGAHRRAGHRSADCTAPTTTWPNGSGATSSERDGSAQEVAEAVKAELEANADW